MRLFGDLVVAAFFEGAKPQERERKRSGYVNAVVSGIPEEHRERLIEWRHAVRPLVPFHWEIEFPEVFERAGPGFDAIVGNPPFLGGKRISTALGETYRDWLASVHAEATSNADLVAHFYRRSFNLIRSGGTLGLIATNTLSQGDTRFSGLRWICENGGAIYRARKRVKWPGLAAVVVSVLHIAKGSFSGIKRLDDKLVETITAFLFHRGSHEDPGPLIRNSGRSFIGNYVLGMGFTFDDTDVKGIASSLGEMRKLIEREPRNQQVIFPYIGGEDLNASPTQAHQRYVINFGARSEEECRRCWPDLMAIVESKVKPERMRVKRDALRERWWQFAEKQPALQRAIAGLERVLVIARVSNAFAFTFLPNGMVYNEKIVVFPTTTFAAFCTLQARVHEVWGRFFNASLKDDMQYTPSDCFQTFPFPEHWETLPSLEATGRTYYEFRAALMVRNNEGLTKTYNRFHDPNEWDPDILRLRELHAAMDRAVLDAYRWSDIPTNCEFLLDYEIDEAEWRNKKKPYRYRWPDDVRDEVLARLLELNAERVKEEARSGAAAAKKRGKKRVPKTSGMEDLFS